jgi:hypothetical protein
VSPLKVIKEFKNERYVMIACVAKIVQTGYRNLTKYIKIDLNLEAKTNAVHIVNMIMAGESDYSEDTVEAYYMNFYYINVGEKNAKGETITISNKRNCRPIKEHLSIKSPKVTEKVKETKDTQVNLKNVLYNMPLNTEYKTWPNTEKTNTG